MEEQYSIFKDLHRQPKYTVSMLVSSIIQKCLRSGPLQPDDIRYFTSFLKCLIVVVV